MAEAPRQVKDKDAMQKFAETVEIKRQLSILRERDKDMKAYWEGVAKAELPDGRGRLTVMPETGNGVAFSVKRSGVSKTRLKELGVSDEVIAQAETTYVGWELF
jgi:hypothetical protein